MSYRSPRATAKDLVLHDALTCARFLSERESPDALYELQSEVSRLASIRRRDDPEYMARMELGLAAARSRIHVPPRFDQAAA